MLKQIQKLGTEAVFDPESMLILADADARPILDDETIIATAITPVSHRQAPVNILVVDDEPRNLTVLEAILEDPAYRLVRAESAEQALHALLADEFALLILDIRMPGATGIELAQLVRARKKTSNVPIIFLTAYYNED